MILTEPGLTYILTLLNFKLQIGSDSEIHSSSRLHCISLCSWEETCMSVFYHSEVGLCTLVNETYTDSSKLKSSDGYEYYLKESPQFRIHVARDEGSSIYDWQERAWISNNTTVPKSTLCISYDGVDQLYYFKGGTIGHMSLTTGKKYFIAQWTNIETVYSLNIDVEAGAVFHTLLIDDFLMIKMDIHTGKNKTIHTLQKPYTYLYRSVLTLDRLEKKLYVIVTNRGVGSGEQSVLTMNYDGKQETTHRLTSDKVYRLIFDDREKQLVYTSDSGIFSWDINTYTNRRLSHFSDVTSPKSFSLTWNEMVIINETRNSSSILVYSRNGFLKYRLKNQPKSENQFYETVLTLIH